MTNINNKIDEFVRKERKKKIILGVMGFVFMGAVFLPLLLPPLGSTSQITGEALRLFGKPTDEGASLSLIVKLDDGSEVRSYIGDSRLYKKGHRVHLLKREPLVVGKVLYTFQGYVDE